MQRIPDALSGLAAFPQFVLYLLVPGSRPGKTDKIPIHWQTGAACNPHDPAAWTTFENAIAQVAAGRGHGVGFTFTANDPYFFVDLDSVLIDGAWSPLAQRLVAAFPGAAVEVSQSGNGLHIIARGACPPHSCDYNVAFAADGSNRDYAGTVQFYTERRFVALTGTHATGNVDADMTYVLPWLVENFFPPAAVQSPADWGAGPRADWRGPTDDDDLIRRALASKSAGAVFGAKATFADLWEANEATLAEAYPSESGDVYGRSVADAALASHLAFWTGCDCARIERLMRRSELMREKWDEPRPGGTYLTLTISNAVAVQRDVCQDREIVPPVAAPVAMTAAGILSGTVKTSATFLNAASQIEFFAGCVYVQDAHRVLIPTGALLKPEQFKARYGGHIFVMDSGNEKTTRDAWEAFTQSNAITFPRADSSWFRPDLTPGGLTSFEGLTYVNTYQPLDIPRAAGDVTPFLEHLARLLPVDRDRAIVLSYMAACVQYRGVKFQWAPLLQGVEGNGKTLLSRCVAYTVGERYTHWPKSKEIGTKFNAWLVGKLFIGVEDVYTPDGRDETFEALKPMLTNERQPVEPKGIDQYSAFVWANFMLNSNHDDAVKKTKNDRRIAPFFTAQQDAAHLARDGMSGDYFPRLYAWLRGGGYAHVAEFLHTYAIPDELNPATHCQRAPETSSTQDAIRAGLGLVEQEILESVAQGRAGFVSPWVSSFALDTLLEKVGRARSLTHRRREKLMRDLGYVKHPSLSGGRVNNATPPDGGKPILFVLESSPEARIASPAEVAKAYAAAQSVTFGGPQLTTETGFPAPSQTVN